VHYTTNYSPFEIVYGFNPLKPLDLIHLPVNARGSLDGTQKAQVVKDLHAKIRQQIEKQNEQYAHKANKGWKLVRFEPGDWVWVHMRKERFPKQRRSKLMPRGDSPFQIIEKINDNAYKVDLPNEYGVNATFNVADLSLFDVGDDSRSNPFEERGDDAIQAPKDPLEVLVGPVTRLGAKRFKETFNGLFQDTWAKVDFKRILNNEEQAVINQEGLVSGTKIITQGLGEKD
jgi:translation initiation factor IF-1